MRNKMTFDDVYQRHYAKTYKANEGFSQNLERTNNIALDTNPQHFSAFLLESPTTPQVNLWYTNLIRWSSYEKKEDIIADLKKYNIDSIMQVKKEFQLISVEEYAEEALKYNRYPATIAFPYSMPKELITTNYKKRKGK